tara:strand:- start:184 stop:507 length:324 start_codon:yes stop_codon:yes gene_type:complete
MVIPPVARSWGFYLNRKELVKANKIEKRYYDLIVDSAYRDLERVSRKYMKYKLPEKYDHLRKMPFYIMLTEGMHYLLEQGHCVHTLNNMINDAKKTAVNFEKQKLKE